jgi:hypothetical protein
VHTSYAYLESHYLVIGANMKSMDGVNHFEPSEKLVNVICNKTQTASPLFFRVLVAYQFAKIASMMRCSIKTHDRGVIPINMYAINLATSGFGKGHSLSIIEDYVIKGFQEEFMESTMPHIAAKNLGELASKRAVRKSEEEDVATAAVEKEYKLAGEYACSFDSGTPAAIKQMRHKLLMANCGALNFEMDEMGSNLLGSNEALTTFLELYDKGRIKQKLTKNTSESVRSEEIIGSTPTNMMLFGTPSKLFNGSKIEEEYFDMLDSGYARRCIFGFGTANEKVTGLTPAQLYDKLTDSTTDAYLDEISIKLEQLADISNFERTLTMSRSVSELILEYKMQCEAIAAKLPDHEEIRKAEISHRYFKAVKLAGAYAFIDSSVTINSDHFYSSIKLVEESGEAFCATFTRERTYEKLAKYLGNISRPVTHTELMEDLPFYKGSESARREQMTLAIAWGYRNNTIIKKLYEDGIEFLFGATLKETNLDKILIAQSRQMAEDYVASFIKFSDISTLTQDNGNNWINHQVSDGIRKREKVLPGFNCVVIDVDEGVSIETVKLLLKGLTYHLYTTKRHQQFLDGKQHGDRFRIIFPISHVLKMDGDEYKEFINNVYEWLPFPMDEGVNQRERKWACNKGTHFSNEGSVLDALQFIPKTSKNEARKQFITDTVSLSNVERWFVDRTGEGNRNKNVLSFALMLVDSGQDVTSVRSNIMAFNNKIQDKLDESEIDQTIMQTVMVRIARRGK